MKRFFNLLAFFLLTLASFAYDVEVNGIYYNLNSETKEAEVTYTSSNGFGTYSDYTGSVVIPEAITSDGIKYKVTSVGNWAFSGCTGLTSVTIPNSVTGIGCGAFCDCSSLVSISIPNSVTSIGEEVFYKCSGLTSITIGNSVTNIGDRAFYDCSSLTSVIIPESVTSIGLDAFQNCSGLTSVTIPNSVTSIGDYAFIWCSSLASVTIPNSVESIGVGAFAGCPIEYLSFDSEDLDITSCFGKNIKTLVVGNSVTSIGDYALSGYSNLTSVTIGNSVTSIGNGAFAGCSGLTTISFPASVTNIGDLAFAGCSGLTFVTIPNSVTSIGIETFSNCSGLTYVTIGDAVTSIGEGTFRFCSALTSVTIGNSVTSIEDYMFEDCSNLTSVTIGNSVTSIGYEAFWGCSGLTLVTIPNSVTSIGSFAFYGCSGLTSVTIPNSVTSIEDGAFLGCSALASIVIPNSVTSMGDYVLSGCTSLIAPVLTNDFFVFCPETYVGGYSIPNGIKTICSGAFDNCYGLTSITIPTSVVNMGEYMFEGCHNLNSIRVAADNPCYDSRDNCNAIIDSRSNSLIQGCVNTIIPNSVESIGVGAFCDIPTLKHINIPSSVRRIGAFAFEECENLETVVIGENVERIDYRAFDDCGIKTIYMRATVPPLYWDEEEDERIESDHMFDEDVYTNATLYVPENAIVYYRISDVWKNFKKILIMENQELLEPIAITTSSTGYATFYSSKTAYQLPEGLSAQVVTSCTGEKLTYKTIADGSVSGIIPKGTAVMLVNEAKRTDTFTLTPSESTTTFSGTNYLNGRDDDGMTSSTVSCNFYKLTYGEGKLSDVFGWYWGAANGAAFNIAGHKAWLALPKSMTNRGTFSIDDSTDIHSTTTDDAETTHYDLQGRRILAPNASGLYITSGKKVFIKK